jgi:integrase
MATYQKRGDSWRAIVRKAGHKSISASFDTKPEAVAWATATEAKINEGGSVADDNSISLPTVARMLTRYALEVSPLKRGERWEVMRLEMLVRNFKVFQKPVSRFSPQDIADWRDERLGVVSASSVNRELNLISAVFTTAIKEWRMPLKENPVHLIRRPKSARPRKRRVDNAEVQMICGALGWDMKSAPEISKHLIAWSFAFAVETAMRRGEILNIRRRDVRLGELCIRLHQTKNDSARDVPLSTRAIELLGMLPSGRPDDHIVPVNAGSFDTLFRVAKKSVGLDDLHFHDSRREAATRMSKLLPNVLELSAVTGHKTLKMLQIYYEPKAADLAAKLG